MSKTRIKTGTEWFVLNPSAVHVMTSSGWTLANKVRVLTSTGWEEVWPVGFPASGTLDADWWVITVWWRDGEDIDVRAYGCEPDIGQDESTLLGWGMQDQWPATDPVITWGGDNVDVGQDGLENRKLSVETILVDVNEYTTQFPSATEIKIDIRSFWYEQAGSLGVVVGAVGYVGGTPAVDSNGYYSVSGYTDTIELQQDPQGIVVTSLTQDDTTTGQYMTSFRYNLSTNLADFVDSECTIPAAGSGSSGAIYYTAAEGSVIHTVSFSSGVTEGYITDITATDAEIVTVPAGTFGAVQVPTRIGVVWVGSVQYVYIYESVWAVPWSGPFPPAGYDTSIYYSYSASAVWSEVQGMSQVSDHGLLGVFESV